MTPQEAAKILGVKITDPTCIIKRKFRALSKQHHPDKSNDDGTKFVEINQAFQTIASLNEALRISSSLESETIDCVFGGITTGGLRRSRELDREIDAILNETDK